VEHTVNHSAFAGAIDHQVAAAELLRVVGDLDDVAGLQERP
jgi:hypothetical protein